MLLLVFFMLQYFAFVGMKSFNLFSLLGSSFWQDYSVHSSWRQRHAAMTPLFAVTQLSQSLGESEPGEDQIDGMVRATQDGGQQFTATIGMTGQCNLVVIDSILSGYL